MNRTPLPDEPPLAAALRACADGLYPAEAAAELLISHASWLCRGDFRDGFVDVGTSIIDGIPVDLRDAFTGMDTVNVGRAVLTMLYTSGHRPGRH